MRQEGELPAPAQTARFRQIVDRCGRPEVHLPLVLPRRDRILRGLERQGRVMTVRQLPRGADFGIVGVYPSHGVQFLIFGRSLRAFAGKRIVGIDYSLLKSSGPQRRSKAPSGRTPPPSTAARPRERPPKPLRRGRVPLPTQAEVREELQRILRLLPAGDYAIIRQRLTNLSVRLETAR
jgi:hypothetical protein